jgi:hypothetical protein
MKRSPQKLFFIHSGGNVSALSAASKSGYLSAEDAEGAESVHT